MSGGVKVVKFESAAARVKRRADGLWVVDWREAGRGRSTTAATEERALKRARAIVKGLSVGQGSTLMTHEDAEIVRLVKELAGDRSAFIWLRDIERIQTRLQGRALLAQAVDHYEQSGLLAIERMSFEHARIKFLGRYKSSSWSTISTMRKAVADFECRYPGVLLTDITMPMLLERLERNKPVAKTFNNRLGFWKTFFNVCRELGYLPQGQKHVAELIKKRKEGDRIPEIFTIEQVRAALKVLPVRYRACLVIGCWLGLRPISEMRRVRWSMFDWDRGYLHIPHGVAGKTMRERYVPIPANVASMLKPLSQSDGLCVLKDDVAMLSKILREHGIIERWVPDIMRHSSISYSIANGASIGQVAEQHGNSEAIIRRRYRRPLRKEDGEEWFKVRMKDEG